MLSKTERIKLALELVEHKDISQDDCIRIIHKILSKEPTIQDHKVIVKGNRKYARWTDSEIKELMKLKSMGKSNKTIAKQLKRTTNSIRVKLNKIKKNNNDINSNGIIKRKWNVMEDKTMIDMLAEGKSFGEIAKTLKRTPKAVMLRYYNKYYKK